MKVLIVSEKDIKGGAARAAYRLHLGLQRIGIKSKMLVQNKYSTDDSVIGPSTNLRRGFNLLRPHLDQIPVSFYNNRKKIPFSPSWFPFSDVVKKINKSDADIVHVHWFQRGMFPIQDLPKIKKPILLTLHDMWLFTGGCHIDGGCGKYIEKCGKCPVLNSHRKFDLSYHTLQRKRNVFGKLELTIVALSNWLAKCAHESHLLKNQKIIKLPNPIDTKIFNPFDKQMARKILGLPLDKRIILFGATKALSNPNKGYSNLISSLKLLNYNNIELCVFGESESYDNSFPSYKVNNFGHLSDNISLVLLYNSADVTVIPSFQESFGQTALESMACGTPAVAFRATGLKDIIDHKKNGYLAIPFDSKDLAKGIDWVLSNNTERNLSINAREKVINEFEEKYIANKYLEIYQKILL